MALPVLLISLAGNYAVARRIAATQGTMQRGWLIFGVTANVAALVIYKFTGFFGANLALVMPGLWRRVGQALAFGANWRCLWASPFSRFSRFPCWSMWRAGWCRSCAR
jgi:hypothetical protein